MSTSIYRSLKHKMFRFNLCIIHLLIYICCGLQTAHSQEVRYPLPVSDKDSRYSYPLELLKLAMSQTQEEVRFLPLKLTAIDNKCLLLLKKKKLDLCWNAATHERLRQFRAVQFPIYRGLLGYRLLFTHNENLTALSKVHTRKALANFSVGLGKSWLDSKIFSKNGFLVYQGSDYESLFAMLANKRFHLFPRSIIEIWPEQKAFEEYELSIEPHLLLHYPLVAYYFVNKDNEVLAQKLYEGLQRITKSGEFYALFDRYYHDSIQQTQSSRRLLIELDNPDFPRPTEAEKQLYYQF
jgi:hypothetical protein